MPSSVPTLVLHEIGSEGIASASVSTKLTRRQFLAAMMAGGVMTAAGLWMPGEKLISIPSRKIYLPRCSLAYLDGPIANVYAGGKWFQYDTRHFDVPVIGAQLPAGAREV
jgi:hypothetical protein